MFELKKVMSALLMPLPALLLIACYVLLSLVLPQNVKLAASLFCSLLLAFF
ncbi:putative lipoprotein [Vibrio parahaemolyticus K5030]|nr:putative lipoprotein [Vibrio parahaemolyticus K5030]